MDTNITGIPCQVGMLQRRMINASLYTQHKAEKMVCVRGPNCCRLPSKQCALIN